MTINVKISLCKITRASKLFQRNYYLPLLKPLSPKDALRRKIITGQNVLGSRIEHYIPALQTNEEKSARRKRRMKGAPVIKKRVRMNDRFRYVSPFFDEDMEGHSMLRSMVARKGKGKGQYYTYEIFDKGCVLVIPYQLERAVRDKDIIDIVVAQRSEKIVIRLSNGHKVTMPVASYDGNGPLYRGSGWTRETVEEEHHHGKETFSIAKIFEAKEQGVEEWELEMMRLATKRKKKIKGEDSADWKEMLQGCLEDMDWDKFEEDTKQIVDEKDEFVEEEDIPMAVDDMEKTKNVNEKLKQAGEEVLVQLPTMVEVPHVIKVLEKGELSELANVSGMRVTLQSGRDCFVTGQMVKNEDEEETFVPGQTVVKEDGSSEYTPGITVYMDNEPTLIPGLVMGETESPAMFLPGESTITESGQLQFEATDDDRPPKEPSPSEESSPSSSSRSPSPQPKKQPRKPQEIVIKRRVFDEEPPPSPKKKERKAKKRPPIAEVPKEKTPPRKVRASRQQVEDPLYLMELKRRQQEEEERKKAKERLEAKQRDEERKVDVLRMQMRQKYKNIKFEAPPPYQPFEPVKKSKQLIELEESIANGTFFEDANTKKVMEGVRSIGRYAKYSNAFINSYGYGTIHSAFLGLNRTYRVH